ncbi:universal stress protein [halophilic archaeon]|nr:universal stress protein [halophilic archaeon]
MYDEILIPTDGSKSVQQAISHGINLANLTGATIHGLYVLDKSTFVRLPEAQIFMMEEALEKEGEQALEDIESQAAQNEIDAITSIKEGIPYEVILEYADDNDIDLIVMGTHGRSGLDRVLLGSVTAKVIRQAEIPVLLKRIADE